MSDAKYFATTKKGEILELSTDLNSHDRTKVKDAVKKVIAAMTLGKDVASLFPDVIKSMPTEDIELKKLVYLYIINYARSQPKKAIMIVNCFQKDAEKHPNPLVRALAIRTLGCIRVDAIIPHIEKPLQAALKDADPYVRKTAALTVAKLYDMNSELAVESGLIDGLRTLLDDSNAMVLANAVAALTEISEAAGEDLLQLNTGSMVKMLTAINQCSEWGIVFLLDMLAKHEPDTESTAVDVCERVMPQLNHANPSVVMSAVKLIIKFMGHIKNRANITKMSKKLAPPLVTLLSGEPEIQYVALRNINLIVQKYPKILESEMRVFFCKYNDAPFVKIEKLETMIRLVNDRNIDQVLAELKEYAQEVDVEFVRKAVRAIGRCAVKLENAAQRCVTVLMELVSSKVSYVVQEAIIVIKDIFRRYPGRYERVIAQLRENLDTLDEPEAKASMIWIIGEYGDRIVEAAEKLEYFVDTFEEEPLQVQLQILTAAVKLFLKSPKTSKDLVQRVLNIATERSDNPDLRDRGFVYWRLLSSNPKAARAVVLADRPEISCDTFQIDDDYLDRLMQHISTLASVYHKPPEAFVKGHTEVTFTIGGLGDDDADESVEESDSDDVSDDDSESEEVEDEPAPKTVTRPKPVSKAAEPDLLDFLNIGESKPVAKPTPSSDPFDMFGTNNSSIPSTPGADVGKVVLEASAGNGLEIRTTYEERVMVLHLSNKSSTTVNNIQVKFNTNLLGINGAMSAPVSTLPPGGTQQVRINLGFQTQQLDLKKPGVQMAIKSELGVGYFKDNVPADCLLKSVDMEVSTLGNTWNSLQDCDVQVVENVKDLTELKRKYQKYEKPIPGKGVMSYWPVDFYGQLLLVQLILLPNGRCKITARGENKMAGTVACRAILQLVSP